MTGCDDDGVLIQLQRLEYTRVVLEDEDEPPSSQAKLLRTGPKSTLLGRGSQHRLACCLLHTARLCPQTYDGVRARLEAATKSRRFNPVDKTSSAHSAAFLKPVGVAHNHQPQMGTDGVMHDLTADDGIAFGDGLYIYEYEFV
jgi:hypothetical protein